MAADGIATYTNNEQCVKSMHFTHMYSGYPVMLMMLFIRLVVANTICVVTPLIDVNTACIHFLVVYAPKASISLPNLNITNPA